MVARHPGLFAVAAREARWIRRDPVARFLLFGVPVIAFAVLGFTFSSSRRARARYCRCRHGQFGELQLFVQTVAAAPGLTIAERANDLGAAASAIRAGRALAAIYLPPDFGKDFSLPLAPRVR